MAKFQEIGRYDIVVKKITERIYDALEVSGQFVEDSAKLLVAVDTGNLRGSITHKVDELELSCRIGTNVEYAPYLEFGTGEYNESGKGEGWFTVTKDGEKGNFVLGQKPQPFLRPALLENKQNIIRVFKEALRK
jgi:HK97 gp10 family phage protein